MFINDPAEFLQTGKERCCGEELFRFPAEDAHASNTQKAGDDDRSIRPHQWAPNLLYVGDF